MKKKLQQLSMRTHTLPVASVYLLALRNSSVRLNASVLMQNGREKAGRLSKGGGVASSGHAGARALTSAATSKEGPRHLPSHKEEAHEKSGKGWFLEIFLHFGGNKACTLPRDCACARTSEYVDGRTCREDLGAVQRRTRGTLE